MSKQKVKTSAAEIDYKAEGREKVVKSHPGKKREFDDADAAVVRALASYGVCKRNIAKEIGTDKDTLKKVYGEELLIGEARAEAQLKQVAWHVAVKLKNPKMIMYLLNTRYGQSESFKVDLTSSDGSMSPRQSAEQRALEFARMMDELDAREQEQV